MKEGDLMIFNEYPYQNLQDVNLDFIIKQLKECIEKVGTISNYAETHEPEYLALKNMVDDLYTGNYPPEFINSLYNWCNRNVLDIIGELSTHVFFGLTDSGYFTAYIPESWHDIVFNTSDYDITLSDRPDISYGHLVLSY